MVQVVVMLNVSVVLHVVTVVLQVVQAIRSGSANAPVATAFSSPAMLSNPLPTAARASAIIEDAFAISDAAIAWASFTAAETIACTVEAIPSTSMLDSDVVTA